MVITGNSNEYGNKPSAIGLGAFDGLHVGHMKLIDTLIGEARKKGLASVVYTFKGDPDDVLKNKGITHLLTEFNFKAGLLAETGLDCLCVEEFTREFMKIEAEDFVKNILVDRLNMKLAVCGFNYTFGHAKKGDVELLDKLGSKYGFELIVIPPVIVKGEVVSSTLIRKYVQKGDIEKAHELLARPFTMSGDVVVGRTLGRTLGFPTANIIPHERATVPANGVYITRTRTGGKEYDSVTNVGTRPTIDSGADRIIVETHILDNDISLYGNNIDVIFLKRLRAEQKFASKEALIAQMVRDADASRDYFKSLKA